MWIKRKRYNQTISDLMDQIKQSEDARLSLHKDNVRLAEENFNLHTINSKLEEQELGVREEETKRMLGHLEPMARWFEDFYAIADQLTKNLKKEKKDV